MNSVIGPVGIVFLSRCLGEDDLAMQESTYMSHLQVWYESARYEPFMFLSLQLPDDDHFPFVHYTNLQNKDTLELGVTRP
jgi:hypothetical protein